MARYIRNKNAIQQEFIKWFEKLNSLFKIRFFI